MSKEENENEALKEALQLQEKVKSFEGLLDQIENLGNKKKALWKEIYENSITDRINAYGLFIELHNLVKGDLTQHAIQGPQLAKYLERMGKCTDQLIKLAEMIAAAERAEAGIDEDEIFNRSRSMK